MLEKLEKLNEQAKGTIFEDFVREQVDIYRKQKQKELKKRNIHNKWIDQADALFHLFMEICTDYQAQLEPFVAKAELTDRREEDGVVLFTVTNFTDQTFSLHCADLHTLDDYEKLEDDAFVETLDEEKEEGGVEFYFSRDEAVKTVKHSDIFPRKNPSAAFKKVVDPLILELFKKSFDIESLLAKRDS
ncbi:hypothetical protein [Lihuaxuella thermophila]|uniref:Uncharacterized protein n=1 Tax=Lihuaxuella thermophila TaxID=1173111 RepID=A0A1H8GR52_9BACL|nr:hypothetical protein [Lihuaxuella thermophila]SEN46300.1 hypothetical protein SAMN05444955_11221 [Lihuaxuella thermophila]